MFNIVYYMPSVVVIFISLIFRNHIFTEIGGNGFSVPAARVNKVKWMYAQAIGPKILLKIGISVFAFSAISPSVNAPASRSELLAFPFGLPFISNILIS